MSLSLFFPLGSAEVGVAALDVGVAGGGLECVVAGFGVEVFAGVGVGLEGGVADELADAALLLDWRSCSCTSGEHCNICGLYMTHMPCRRS